MVMNPTIGLFEKLEDIVDGDGLFLLERLTAKSHPIVDICESFNVSMQRMFADRWNIKELAWSQAIGFDYLMLFQQA